jgi:hypothetical protein
MVDNPLGRQPGDRTAKRALHAGMAHGEATNIEFIEKTGHLFPAWLGLFFGYAANNRLGHEGRRIHRFFTTKPQARRANKDPIKVAGIGINQQLVRIEKQTLIRIIGAIGPQSIACASADIGDQPGTDVVLMHIKLKPLDFLIRLIKQAYPYSGGAFRINCEIHPIRGDRSAELLCLPGTGHQFWFH